MLPKLSRYLLVLLTIITLAYVLPAVYNTLFDTRINTPFVTYSELKKEYFVMRNIDGKPAFVDRNKKVYTQQEFMDVTPIANFQYHLSRGTLPDTLNGVKLNAQQLQHESIFQFISPENLYTPSYGLYPLFESEPEFGLRFPADVFRINERVEFIDAKTNKINAAKSETYTTAFKQLGFVFPAKLAAGIPSVMKRRDQGWFIEDRAGQLFHLKMVKGQPYFKKVPNPEKVSFKHILCNDFDSDEFYAVVISDDNHLYTINKADYSLSKFPINNYNPEKQTVMISGNLFNKTISVMDDEAVKVYTVDRKYQPIDQFKETLPLKSEMAIGKIFQALFPFYLNVSSPYTDFIKMALVRVSGNSWIFLNGILLIVSLVLMRREGRKIGGSIPDLLIVAVTGIFGFLAIWMFPNKTY
uniref:DUF4857 domain-containing protein n=1 Tax=Pedobacter schmidteae TaxID=2201271 RepID=UPI000EB2C770|nr:DUF4857 domain-containing protein [Pedobacter schmidteae]